MRIFVFLFANSKCKRYFHNRLKPSKLTWTAVYRKQHKKVHCWCLEVIQKKKRAEKPKVRDAAREAVLQCVFILFVSAYFCICISGFIIDVEIKKRIKKTKDEKKTKKPNTDMRIFVC
ncbi:60S ribosomal protein L24 [Glycine soja]|nr:60S ribosomal protein L24 [Glycine max]